MHGMDPGASISPVNLQSLGTGPIHYGVRFASAQVYAIDLPSVALGRVCSYWLQKANGYIMLGLSKDTGELTSPKRALRIVDRAN